MHVKLTHLVNCTRQETHKKKEMIFMTSTRNLIILTTLKHTNKQFKNLVTREIRKSKKEVLNKLTEILASPNTKQNG